MNQPDAPRWQLGYLSPLPVVDAIHYEFYRVLGSAAVLVAQPAVVSAFTGPAVEDALLRLDAAIDMLRRREVDRIVYGGMPLSAIAGRQRMIDVLGEAQRHTGIATTSDVEDIIACLRARKVATIAIAAKWAPEVMRRAEAYFRDAGFEVMARIGSDYDAAAVMQIVTPRSAPLAIGLGIAAGEAAPDADAIVLGGGTWLTIPATQAIEAACGKGVFSNTTAMLTQACAQFGLPLGPIGHLLMNRP